MSSVLDQPTALPAVPRTATVPVDVIIITFNEQINLPHTLATVIGWAHRVLVIDSGSADGTRETARGLGAEVIEHAWEGYARQKNWALSHLPLESPWTLIIDADEAVSEPLRAEIAAICAKDPDMVPQAGFYINRELVFLGKPIHHCGYSPSWNLRLFKRGRARYEDRPVHEHMILDGPEGYLKAVLIHEDRRGLEYYIAKHNRYSTLEAETLFFADQKENPAVRPALFGNAVQRRRWLRTALIPRLPARCLWRFLWMYFLRLGFLDGMNGLRFCLLISAHELFTSLKLRELEANPVQVPTPTVARQIVSSSRTHTVSDRAAGSPTCTHVATAHAAAPMLSAQREESPWTAMEKIKRVFWMFASVLLFRLSFHNWYAWRRFVLRRFGAKIGRDVRIRPTVRIEIPWNLEIGEGAVVGDYAILYCLGRITIGRYAVISQYSHLCAGTHDYTTRRFPLVRLPITIGDEVWVAADSFIAPDVTIGDRSVVGARSTVTRDIPPDQVWVGSPAKYIKDRELTA